VQSRAKTSSQQLREMDALSIPECDWPLSARRIAANIAKLPELLGKT